MLTLKFLFVIKKVWKYDLHEYTDFTKKNFVTFWQFSYNRGEYSP